MWGEKPESLADPPSPPCAGRTPFTVRAVAANSHPACQTSCRECGTAGVGTGKTRTGPALGTAITLAPTPSLALYPLLTAHVKALTSSLGHQLWPVTLIATTTAPTSGSALRSTLWPACLVEIHPSVQSSSMSQGQADRKETTLVILTERI